MINEEPRSPVGEKQAGLMAEEAEIVPVERARAMTNAELKVLLDQAALREDAGREPFDDDMARGLTDRVLRPAISWYLSKLTKSLRMAPHEVLQQMTQELWQLLLESPPRKKATGGTSEDDESELDREEGSPSLKPGQPRWRQAREAKPCPAAYFRRIADNFLFKASQEGSSRAVVHSVLRSLLRGKKGAELEFEIFNATAAKADKKTPFFRRQGSKIQQVQELGGEEMLAWVRHFESWKVGIIPTPKDCEKVVTELLAVQSPGAALRELEAIRMEDVNRLIRQVWRLPPFMIMPAEPAPVSDTKDDAPEPTWQVVEERVPMEGLEVWRSFLAELTRQLAGLDDGQPLSSVPADPAVPHEARTPYGSAFAGFVLWQRLPYQPEGNAPYVMRQHTRLTGIPKSSLNDRIAKVELVFPAAAVGARLRIEDARIADVDLQDYLRHRFAAWKPPGVIWDWTPPGWLREAEAELDRAGNARQRRL